MNNSDYLFELVQRQRHEELVREAAERRLARSVRAHSQRPARDWWQRLGAGLGLAPARRASRGPARLQSVRT